jgi:hypothetical protein
MIGANGRILIRFVGPAARDRSDSSVISVVLLLTILCSSAGVSGQNQGSLASVSDLDGLYQALLSKSTHIVVTRNIEEGEILICSALQFRNLILLDIHG